MTQKSTTSDLTSDQILKILSKSIWEKDGNEGKPPYYPTPDELCQWMPPLDTQMMMQYHEEQPLFHPESRLRDFPKTPEPDKWQAQVWHRLKRCKLQHAIDVPAKFHEVEKTQSFRLPGTARKWEMTVPVFEILNPEEIKPRAAAKIAIYAVLDAWNNEQPPESVELHGIHCFSDGIVAIHQLWAEVNQRHPGKFSHPLAPIVQAWIQDQTAKHINPEYNRKHPVAILKHPMGSYRDLTFTDAGEATLREFASPERGEQIQTHQLDLGFADAPSILPAVMPLHAAHPMGVKATTKSGAVSHVVRIFFEALMALSPSQHKADIMFRLGDLIGYLYPGYRRDDGSFDHKKFNRTLQLPHIIEALGILHFYATVPFRDDQGDLRVWRPVTVNSPVGRDAKNDTPVFMRVNLPPDAQQGYMILKEIHRQLGKNSGPQFNAYHAAAALWDKYGTVRGKLIDPTRPVENRNETGALLDANGNPIRNARGTTITNLYDERAVSKLDRERNPAADRYPILSEEDLIRACNPNSYKKANRRKVLQRAKAYWIAMEKEGIISIEKKGSGWRILPSEKHVQAQRAVREATQK